MIANIVNEADFQKKLLYFNGALPGVLLLVDWMNGNLGANPPEAVIRTSGVIAILFLLLSLAVTPMAKITKWSWIIKHKRWLGLWSFYYALIHFLSYALFDKGLNFLEILADLFKRPFILLGLVAFLLMLPLAMTSNNYMIKKMGGRRWKMLHKATYLVAVLTSIHYWMIVKSDIFYPGIIAGLFFILLLYRFLQSRFFKAYYSRLEK